MDNKKIYETPCIMEIELASEQAVLAASGGPYPGWEEEDWGN